METGYSQRKYSELSSGSKMPRIGYGTGMSKGLDTILEEAINIGYRHIDTAALYGNEEIIGKAVNKAINEGKVKREDLFITTKVFSEKHDVAKSLNKSLQDLQLDYVDLFLIHWPFGDWDKESQTFKQPPLHVTWKQMEDLVKQGKCKAIGVSNFNVQLLVDLLSYAEIKPVCNQVEVHPYLVQEDLIRFCKKNNIEIVAYSPLGSSYPEPSGIIKEPAVLELANKYNKTPSQIILNWHLSRGYVAIPRTSTLSRLRDNLESDTFEMTPEEIKSISALNKNARVWDLKDMEMAGNVPAFA